MKKLALAAAFVLCLAPVAACDDGANEEGAGGAGGAGDAHASYEGTFSAGPGENGTMMVNVHSSHASSGLLEGITDGSADGMLHMGATMIDLIGTLAGSTLHLTGGGYDFTGTITLTGIDGTYTGPNGPGSFSVQDISGGAVAVYCGDYTGDADGSWNLVERADGSLSGVALPGAGALTGTRTGDAISLTFDGGTATGTITGTTASGVWTLSAGGGGSWTGVVGDCQ